MNQLQIAVILKPQSEIVVGLMNLEAPIYSKSIGI